MNEVGDEASGARNVELQTAREHLDAASKRRRVEVERNRLLGTIQVFFGLDS